MTSKTPAFLLGAGFNADAKVQVGPVYGESIYIGKHEIQCAYPLLGDLAQLCFGLPSPPAPRALTVSFPLAPEDRAGRFNDGFFHDHDEPGPGLLPGPGR